MTDSTHDANGLEALLGLEAAKRIRTARSSIDREYARAGPPPAEIIAARHAIDDEFAHAIRGVRDHADETRKQTTRTNRTVTILAVSVICMLLLAAATTALLIVRGNDIQNIQNQIESAQTAIEEHQSRLCPLLDFQAHSKDPQLAAVANAVAKTRGCPGY